MPQQQLHPYHIIDAFESMMNEKLSQDQFIEISTMIEEYADQRLYRFIEFTSNQQATNKQPAIDQLPPKEQTSLDNLLPF